MLPHSLHEPSLAVTARATRRHPAVWYGLLRADAKTRAETYEKALNPATGWMRRDEVRELEDMPPEENAA